MYSDINQNGFTEVKSSKNAPKQPILYEGWVFYIQPGKAIEIHYDIWDKLLKKKSAEGYKERKRVK